MTASKIKPLIDAHGEVREITMNDLKHAKRGRPPLPLGEGKERVNITLDANLIAKAKTDGVKLSTRLNELLRADLEL